jgi:S-formylglutathione hydrolase FrmB
MSTPTILSKNRVGSGTYYRITHLSTSTKTPMTFGLFVPSRFVANVEGEGKENVPVMYWLSGLTCDDTNFAMKAGAKAFVAAEKEVRT